MGGHATGAYLREGRAKRAQGPAACTASIRSALDCPGCCAQRDTVKLACFSSCLQDGDRALHCDITAMFQGCPVASSCGEARFLNCLQPSGAGWLRLMMMQTAYLPCTVSGVRTMGWCSLQNFCCVMCICICRQDHVVLVKVKRIGKTVQGRIQCSCRAADLRRREPHQADCRAASVFQATSHASQARRQKQSLPCQIVGNFGADREHI